VKSRALTPLKIVVLPGMPIASVSTATIAKPGARTSVRTAYLRSCQSVETKRIRRVRGGLNRLGYTAGIRPLRASAGLAVPAPRDNQRHVVALFLRTEAADAVVNGGDQISWRQVTMRVQRLDEPSFPELIVLGVEGLGDPIGVDRQKISSGEPELRRPALPRGEQAQHCCRRLEPFDLAGASQHQRRQMSAVRVAQASRSVVELRGVVRFGNERPAAATRCR
jgi:hypothetical protein